MDFVKLDDLPDRGECDVNPFLPSFCTLGTRGCRSLHGATAEVPHLDSDTEDIRQLHWEATQEIVDLQQKIKLLRQAFTGLHSVINNPDDLDADAREFFDYVMLITEADEYLDPKKNSI